VPGWPDLERTAPARSGAEVAGLGARRAGSEAQGWRWGRQVALGTPVGGRWGSPVKGRLGGVVGGGHRLQRRRVERPEWRRRLGLVATTACLGDGGWWAAAAAGGRWWR
jgi:hypothetical protein